MTAQTPRNRPRRILLADADAFYVSVARLTDPEGAGRAPLLIVGGTADGRGVVTSASYEAREYGVRSAMPTAQALRLCPRAVVVPVPGACGKKSREIRQVLVRFTPVVEPASIDEFYLDLTGTERLYAGESLSDIAQRVRTAVLESTAMPVSLGGGTSKLIAKLAAKRAKPRPGRDGTGVYVVPPGAELDFMLEHDLAAIPMIGPKFQEKLAKYGLRTVRDAMARDRRDLTKWFGNRAGAWLFDRVRGRDGARVVSKQAAKSMSHEETFPRDLSSDQDLERELLRLSTRLASDLRTHGLKTRTITVKLRDADFTTRQASHSVREHVDGDQTMYVVARALLRRLRGARRTAARLIGVAASQLSAEGGSPQLALFSSSHVDDAVETERDRALSSTVDRIHEKFGRRGIVRGRTMEE